METCCGSGSGDLLHVEFPVQFDLKISFAISSNTLVCDHSMAHLNSFSSIDCAFSISIFYLQQRWLTKALRFKYCVPNPRPQAHVCELAYRVVSSSSLDWFIFFVLLLDFALSLTYVLVSDGTSVLVLHYCNYIIVAIYMAEAILKVCRNKS